MKYNNTIQSPSRYP